MAEAQSGRGSWRGGDWDEEGGCGRGEAEQVIAKIKPMRHAIQKQFKELVLLPQKLLSSIFGV